MSEGIQRRHPRKEERLSKGLNNSVYMRSWKEFGMTEAQGTAPKKSTIWKITNCHFAFWPQVAFLFLKTWFHLQVTKLSGKGMTAESISVHLWEKNSDSSLALGLSHITWVNRGLLLSHKAQLNVVTQSSERQLTVKASKSNEFFTDSMERWPRGHYPIACSSHWPSLCHRPNFHYCHLSPLSHFLNPHLCLCELYFCLYQHLTRVSLCSSCHLR